MRYAKLFLVTVGILIIASCPSMVAQSSQSARSLGMADSYLMLSANCEAAIINPANLALPGRSNYSVKLFSISGYVANNAFTLADYNKYNGAYLLESDKADILSKIPTDGLSLDFGATASALSFSVGAFAFTSEVIAGGKGTISKDPIELVLMGNKVGQMISADGSDADGWTATAFSLSYGRNIYRNETIEIVGGVSAKYLRGLYYYGAEELSAEGVTLQTGFEGSGGLETISSSGGSGYALDIGFAADKSEIQFGLVFRNLLASINWNQEIDNTVYQFEFQNLTVDNASDDTVWIADDYELPTTSFTSRPPLEIELGAARHFGKLLTSASIKQGFKNTAFVSKTPRLGGGVEYPLFNQLDLRSGFAIGGTESFSVAMGLGLNLGPVLINGAYSSAARLVPWGGRGGNAAISVIIDF